MQFEIDIEIWNSGHELQVFGLFTEWHACSNTVEKFMFQVIRTVQTIDTLDRLRQRRFIQWVGSFRDCQKGAPFFSLGFP